MAAAMLFAAALIPVLITGSLLAGVIFGLMASTGLLLGMLARRRTAIGVTITVLTGVLYVLLAGLSAAGWNEIRSDFHEGIEQYKTKLESQTEEAATEDLEAVAKGFKWLEDNLPYIYFGGLFAIILLATTGVTVAIYRNLSPVISLNTVNYRFIWMRPSEHLVWLAIAVACLWFWDNRWPDDNVRFLAWNGAIALAALYWLNGLSILLFAWHRWNFNRPFLFILLTFMVLFNIIYMLSIVGFFDTWINFRRRLVPALPPDKPKTEDDPDRTEN